MESDNSDVDNDMCVNIQMNYKMGLNVSGTGFCTGTQRNHIGKGEGIIYYVDNAIDMNDNWTVRNRANYCFGLMCEQVD